MIDRPNSTETPRPELETMAERVARLEKQLSQSSTPNVAALEEQLADRVMSKLNERMKSLPQLNAGPSPPGFTSHIGASMAGLVTAAALAGSPASGWKSWMPALGEFALMARMYFDSRYRLSRFAQLAVPGISALMVFNYFFFTQLMITIWIITPTLERLVLIVLAVALYKVLSREAGRYAEVLRYLAKFEGKPS